MESEHFGWILSEDTRVINPENVAEASYVLGGIVVPWGAKETIWRIKMWRRFFQPKRDQDNSDERDN